MTTIATTIMTAFVFAFVGFSSAHAAYETTAMTNYGTNLSDLVVLDTVFGDDNSNWSDSSNLKDLVLLDYLGNWNTTGMTSANSTVFGNSNLGSYVVLDELFNNDNNADTNVSMNNSTSMSSDNTDSGIDLKDLVLLDSVRGQDTVTVETGDTLSGIASQFLYDASRWSEIAAINNISNPKTIQPGQVLTLPAVSAGITNQSRLGDLVVLDAVFGDDNGSGIFDSDSTLKDLVILDGVFNTSGSSVLGSNTDLGSYVILDQVFGDNGDSQIADWVILNAVLNGQFNI